ncbi:MAG TPA: hypothetical protein VNX27_11900 [Chthoniobacterales bacterium]|nr:hypothetical protein [Chthoniobacterales bacterium]
MASHRSPWHTPAGPLVTAEAEAVSVVVVLVAALVLASPVLLNLEPVWVGFMRRVRAELSELERAEAE